MENFKLAITVEREAIAEVLIALASLSGVTVQIVTTGSMSGTGPQPGSLTRREPIAPNAVSSAALAAMAQTRTTVSHVPTIDREPTTYRWTRINPDALSLTRQQRMVIAYVVQYGEATAQQIETATGIGKKSVQSAIYQLRKTQPALLVSSND